MLVAMVKINWIKLNPNTILEIAPLIIEIVAWVYSSEQLFD